MTYFVHLPESCLKEAQTHQSFDEDVIKFAEKLEKAQSIDLLEPFGSHFVVKDFGKSYRLVIRKICDQDDCLLIFWRFVPKSSRDYSDICKNPDGFVDKFDQEFSKEEIKAILQQRRTTVEEVAEIQELSDVEKEFLYQPLSFSAADKDWMILESEDWLSRTSSTSFSGYLSDLHRLLLQAIEKKEDTIVDDHQVGILLQRFPQFKILFLIAPVRPDNQEEIEKLHQKYSFLFAEGVEEQKIIRHARRSYPETVVYDDSLWIQEIQQQDEKANLALSQEEVKLLQQPLGFYPLFINGRPGSGKSTVLQYLFAEYLFNYHPQRNQIAPPVYLTYSPELLEIARNLVLKLLTSNAGKIIKSQISPETARELTRNTFFVFRDFLLRLLPDRRRFSPDRYVHYPTFRYLYDKQFAHHPDRTLRSMAEIAWHVIRTYIKGSVSDSDEYMDPEDFLVFPSKHKSVTSETFDLVYNEIWENWYKKLGEEDNYWDDQDLARAVLKAMWEEQLPEVFQGHSVIFCDEAQDFTRNELRLIFRLSVFSRRKLHPEILNLIPFAFAGDPFQTLNPTGFDWDSTSENLYQIIRNQIDRRQDPTLEINYQELQFNYRSRKSIVQLCNFIHLLRGIAFEKKNLKPQRAWYDDPSDMPSIFDIESPVVATKLKSQENNVIIIPCQEGEELSYVQNDPLLKTFALSEDGNSLIRNILSPMRAKGQEFDRVVLYCFGDACSKEEQYKQLLPLVDPNQNHSSALSPEQRIPLEYFINRLYVGASRARRRILIVDTKEGIEKFWKFFTNYDLDTFTQRYQQICRTTLSEWDPATHLVKIQPGISDDWEKDFNDPLELANQFMESGKQKEDSYLLERAAQNFRLAEQEDKALECEALSFKFDREFVRAGERFEALGRILEAEECYWKAKAFKRIDQLQSGTSCSLAAKFMQNSQEYSFADTRALLDRISQSLVSSEIKLDEVWSEVLTALYHALLEKGKEQDLKPFEWKQYYTQAGEFRKQGILPASVEADLNQILVRATPYPEKLEVLWRLGTKPAEILRFYRNHPSVDLSREQARIVFDALKQEEKYHELEEFLRRFPSIEHYGNLLSTYLQSERFFEDRERLVLDLFRFLVKQRNWDAAFDLVFSRSLPGVSEGINSVIDKYYKENLLLDAQFIKALSVSDELANAETAVQSRVSGYLESRLIERASAFYFTLTVAQAGAAMERSGKIKGCLDFYELIWNKKEWPAVEEDVRFARERWLKCKQRQYEKLARTDEEKSKIQREILQRQNDWGIRSLSNLPEFPVVDLNARPKPPKVVQKQEPKPPVLPLPTQPETPKPTLVDKVKETISLGEKAQEKETPKPAMPAETPAPPQPESQPMPAEPLKPSTIHFEVTHDSQTFEVDLDRSRGKMVVKRKDELEMITITARNMKVQGSDEDFNAEIETREQKHGNARYFVRPWNLTCILRRHGEQVFVDLYCGEKKVELFNTRLN